MQQSFMPVRYVLVVRDIELKRLATVSTSRSLVGFEGLLKSLFAQFTEAHVVDVVLPGWSSDQKVDEQEIQVSAQRSNPEDIGTFLWHKIRDLRAIEEDIAARLAAAANAEIQA